MSKALFACCVLIVLVFVSCVSAPPPAQPVSGSATAAAPASSAEKDRAKALVTGTMSTEVPAAPAQTTQAAQATPTIAEVDAPPPPPGVLTPEEEAYLTNYLNRLNYMVYFDEATGLDPKIAKTAVNQANRYLIEKLGRTVMDFDQVEKNKKDQQTAYQAETGGAIGIIQFLAQKFNADVYVEVSFSTTKSSTGGRHYAAASGSMKIFDTSTAQLLGAVAFQSPEVMSTVSLEQAETNAVSASVWNGMPRMIDQSRMLVKNSLSRGIRYEVIIQKTPDSRAISNLRRFLGRAVREVEQASYSPEETRLAIFTFGNATKVEDAIYDAAERAGMLDIYLVFSRGKSFTFNTGM
jgi:hypothetical protein